jgi:sulfate transport system substrate-binding protein
MGWKSIVGLVLLLCAIALWCAIAIEATTSSSVELLNVSYDPTRELWRDLNAEFVADYQRRTGTQLTIRQSHAGSASQARAVIDGLDADVATLALWQDTDAIRKHGLIADGWEDRLPNRSLPYSSTIVFVVRKGNPKDIRDWSDLLAPGIEIITPNPKTSGNGKLSFLAAWASVISRGGTEEEAHAYVAELYRRVPVLDISARAATSTFAQKGIGDVHLTGRTKPTWRCANPVMRSRSSTRPSASAPSPTLLSSMPTWTTRELAPPLRPTWNSSTPTVPRKSSPDTTIVPPARRF